MDTEVLVESINQLQDEIASLRHRCIDLYNSVNRLCDILDDAIEELVKAEELIKSLRGS